MSFRIVHRHKTLKDEDLVPDDTVDNGEQGEVEEVLNGEGLDLSYLWVVNAKNLGRRSRLARSDAEGSSSTAIKKRISSTTTEVQVSPLNALMVLVSSMSAQTLDTVKSAALTHQKN